MQTYITLLRSAIHCRAICKNAHFLGIAVAESQMHQSIETMAPRTPRHSEGVTGT